MGGEAYANIDKRADPRVAAYWREFCATTGTDATTPYQAWYFGHDAKLAAELVALVVAGTKRATASLKWSCERFPEVAPVVGVLSVVTEFDGTPRAVIRTVQIDTIPFNKVSAGFATAEGEGDGSLEYWRRGHWEFFGEECAQQGFTLSETMPVVCERFELLYAEEMQAAI
jgi:uncharacterized protein YhfF